MTEAQARVEELIDQARDLLSRCNTIPLATANFLFEANAINRAILLLDKAQRELNAQAAVKDSPPAVHGANQNHQRS
jgi:hypothetical protein